MKILAALLAVLGAVPCANSVAAELHGGWAVWVPYQYEKASPGGLKTLSGLDIEVMRAASDIAGLDVSFEQTPWSENLRAVADGKLDFALGATRETSREVYARFSRPYRKESIYLFTRSGDGRKWRAASPIESLKGIRERGGKLAVEAGYYYGPEVAAILAEPTDRQWVIRVPDPSAALSALISGEADAMLSDRVAGPSVAWDARSLNKIEELSGPLYETDLCFAFSKKTVSPEMVASYDRALDSLKSSGELERMTRHYLVPRLLMITLGTTWFSALEIIGIVAFAISGVIIARRENYDIIGAAVLAFLPALGGGVLRDVISGRSPISVLQSPLFVLVVLSTVVAGFLFFVVRDLLQKTYAPPAPKTKFRWLSTQGLLEITDALGLAAFTIVGVMVAIEQGCEPLWLWGPIMACVTGAGGGVLRDVLRARADIPTLKGQVYPEIALLGGLLYSIAILRRTIGIDLLDMTWLTLFIVCGVFVTRLLVVQFGIRSLFLASPFKRRKPSAKPG